MEISLGLGRALWWLGLLLILAAIVDIVCARLLNFDLTGVSWSPIALGITGSLLLRFFRGDDSDD